MDQAWPESTRDNLRFLCSEVDSQYGWLQAFVSAPTAAMARKLLERARRDAPSSPDVLARLGNPDEEEPPRRSRRVAWSLRGVRTASLSKQRLVRISLAAPAEMTKRSPFRYFKTSPSPDAANASIRWHRVEVEHKVFARRTLKRPDMAEFSPEGFALSARRLQPCALVAVISCST